MVTNAFKYGRGTIRLAIDVSTDGVVTVTVSDRMRYRPLPDAAPAGTEEESGRGLWLVELLSHGWGHRSVGGNPAHGTAVWATLDGGKP